MYNSTARCSLTWLLCKQRSITDCSLWSSGATEKRCIFHLHLCLILLIIRHQEPSRVTELIHFQCFGGKCGATFSCLHWHPQLFHFIIFSCNYKDCHTTLPSVQCPSNPLMLVCLPNDEHHHFLLSFLLYQGNKVTPNHMLMCQTRDCR